jgi:hypothetical protein
LIGKIICREKEKNIESQHKTKKATHFMKGFLFKSVPSRASLTTEFSPEINSNKKPREKGVKGIKLK